MTGKSVAEKYRALTEYLAGRKKAAVAFSGGVDSSFLLNAAKDALGQDVIALTADVVSFPRRELEEAEKFCLTRGIPFLKVAVDQLSLEGFAENPADRCYICKKALFGALIKKAKDLGFSCVIEGTNADDADDYRPGLRAVRELGMESPLLDFGWTKEEIRKASCVMGLPTWNKPAMACLATRVPCGEPVTKEKLALIEKAEEQLFDLGLSKLRVRISGGDLARIEVEKEEMDHLFDIKDEVVSRLEELGFRYVTMDLSGYRTGSTNEMLIKSAFP